MGRLAKILLYAGLAMCLLQVWLPAYYVTGDGPCHVYNAQVLHDLWLHKNSAFYNNFYQLSYHANPNWLSHIVLASLMFLFNGVVAEKILVTGYVLLFITGFVALLKRLGSNNAFLPLLSFIFVFNYILSKGFYNFSFSIAIFFWMVEIWLRYLDSRRKQVLVPFFLLALLSFFTHPLPFAFGCFTCFALTLSVALSGPEPFTRRILTLSRNLLVLLLCLVPGILLFLKFTLSEGGTSGIHPGVEHYRIYDLLYGYYMVSYSSHEMFLAKMLAYLFSILFVVSLAFRLLKGFAIQQYDGLLVACALAGLIYLYFPDNLLGGGAFSVRAHYILFLLGACCIAWLLPYDKVKASLGVVLFACFVVLSVIRITCQLSASRAVNDISSCAAYIKPNSVVLPLDFSPNGKDENGNMIADRNWLFTHAAQYIGVMKPLIFLDNYEANVGYFPLLWKEEVNPYHHLGSGGSFESQPPAADIEGYKNTSGVTINYILMWCFDSSALNNEHFGKLYGQIMAGYNKVYTSPTKRTVLFEKK